jgi:hypothetical protein
MGKTATATTNETIAAVLMARGVPTRILSKRLGISPSTVNRIQHSVAAIETNGQMVTITRREQS